MGIVIKMLSRKYYKDIAGILRVSSSKEEIVKRLCRYFELDNPRFDKNKFLEEVYGYKTPDYCAENDCSFYFEFGGCQCFAPCEKCGKETLHINTKCSICGTPLK